MIEHRNAAVWNLQVENYSNASFLGLKNVVLFPTVTPEYNKDGIIVNYSW